MHGQSLCKARDFARGKHPPDATTAAVQFYSCRFAFLAGTIVPVNPDSVMWAPVPRNPDIIDTAIPISRTAGIIRMIVDVDYEPDRIGRDGCT